MQAGGSWVCIIKPKFYFVCVFNPVWPFATHFANQTKIQKKQSLFWWSICYAHNFLQFAYFKKLFSLLICIFTIFWKIHQLILENGQYGCYATSWYGQTYCLSGCLSEIEQKSRSTAKTVFENMQIVKRYGQKRWGRGCFCPPPPQNA